MDKATDEMIAEYNSGKTVRDVAGVFGISTGKMFYLLKDAGCIFRKRGHQKGGMTYQ